MAAIDFPASPTSGQLFSAANGVTYQWNGTLWLALPVPVPPYLRLYDEVVLAANALEMRVNVPAGAKKIEIEYLAINVATAADAVCMRALVGSTPNTTANYHTQLLTGAASTATATGVASGTQWQVVGAAVTTKGTFRPVVTSAQCYVEATHWVTQAAQMIVCASSHHGVASAGATGFQLFNFAGVQFAPGSWLRCWVGL